MIYANILYKGFFGLQCTTTSGQMDNWTGFVIMCLSVPHGRQQESAAMSIDTTNSNQQGT